MTRTTHIRDGKLHAIAEDDTHTVCGRVIRAGWTRPDIGTVECGRCIDLLENPREPRPEPTPRPRPEPKPKPVVATPVQAKPRQRRTAKKAAHVAGYDLPEWVGWHNVDWIDQGAATLGPAIKGQVERACLDLAITVTIDALFETIEMGGRAKSHASRHGEQWNEQTEFGTTMIEDFLPQAFKSKWGTDRMFTRKLLVDMITVSGKLASNMQAPVGASFGEDLALYLLFRLAEFHWVVTNDMEDIPEPYSRPPDYSEIEEDVYGDPDFLKAFASRHVSAYKGTRWQYEHWSTESYGRQRVHPYNYQSLEPRPQEWEVINEGAMVAPKIISTDLREVGRPWQVRYSEGNSVHGATRKSFKTAAEAHAWGVDYLRQAGAGNAWINHQSGLEPNDESWVLKWQDDRLIERHWPGSTDEEAMTQRALLAIELALSGQPASAARQPVDTILEDRRP